MSPRTKTLVMLAATLVFMGAIAFRGNQYLLQLVLGVAIIAILALSWDTLCRVGQVSLGQAAFFGLGAYAYAMAGEVNATVAWIAVPLVCGVVAAALGMLTLRLQHVYFSIATLGFTLSLQVLVLALADWTGGAGGISPPPIGFGDDTSQLVAITIVLLLGICASQYFLSTNVRPALFMIRTRPELAAVSGVPLVRTKILTLVVSAILAGLAGACYGGLYGYIVPTDVFVLNWSIIPLAVAILGGRDSTIGPILGAVMLRLLEEAARAVVGGVGYQVVYGAVIILCILLMPTGISGAIRKVVFRPATRGMADRRLGAKEA